jgi:hypothetical protein
MYRLANKRDADVHLRSAFQTREHEAGTIIAAGRKTIRCQLTLLAIGAVGIAQAGGPTIISRQFDPDRDSASRRA